MKIWLDDIRDAPDGTWVVVRSVREFSRLDCIEVPGEIDLISLDHDLGEDQMTGYDLAKQFEQWAGEGNWDLVPKAFQIHSANPVGRKNMQAAIDSIERMRHGDV